MATNTTNYNLIKPDYEDDADIKDLNDNFDTIDMAMNNLEEGKQAALTTAQMAAVNSGIDSTKVAQIETNRTDIASKQDAATAINTTNLESAAYALGKVTNLGDLADLNAITTIGNYYGNSNSITNKPANIKTFRLLVQSDGNTANYVEQIFNEYQGAREYRRYNTSSISSGDPVTWSPWVLVNDDISSILARITALENAT